MPGLLLHVFGTAGQRDHGTELHSLAHFVYDDRIGQFKCQDLQLAGKIFFVSSILTFRVIGTRATRSSTACIPFIPEVCAG